MSDEFVNETEIRAHERRLVNMSVNTQRTSREIDQIIHDGGDGGQILNLIMDKIMAYERDKDGYNYPS